MYTASAKFSSFSYQKVNRTVQYSVVPSTTKKLGIVLYLPYQNSDFYVIQFITMLYGSWKFVTSKPHLRDYATKYGNSSKKPSICIDLLVYCHKESCKRLPKDCIKWSKKPSDRFQPTCYYHQEHEFADTANYLLFNMFIYVQDPHFMEMINHYDYFLRTDVDVFITPTLLAYTPTQPLIAGQGGYSTEWNSKRLEGISAKLGLVHKKVHSVGSTWYAESKVFNNVSKLTLTLIRHFVANEFDKSLPGLKHVFDKDPVNGEWPKWWKPVSALYGQELAVNHLVPNFSRKNVPADTLDASSCDHRPALTFLHIHCWHNPCEFMKFSFMDTIQALSRKQSWDDRFYKYAGDLEQGGMDMQTISASEYCTFLAWNSAIQYIPSIISIVRSKFNSTYSQQAGK